MPGESLKGNMHEKPVYISACLQQSLVAAFKENCELKSYHCRDDTQVRKRKWESEVLRSNLLLIPKGIEVWQASICWNTNIHTNECHNHLICQCSQKSHLADNILIVTPQDQQTIWKQSTASVQTKMRSKVVILFL